MAHKIAVVPGDGIGPEVLEEGCALLAELDRALGLGLVLDKKDWGAERWLKEKVGLPKGALDELARDYSAIYFGALGDPRIPDMAHGREILLGMRQGLDLYANFRPCKCLHESLSPLRGKGPAEIDMLVFRENTEDLYVSLGGTFKEGTADEVAQDVSINTRKGVERILRHGFDVARARPKADGTKKLTMTDKHNAVRFGGGLRGAQARVPGRADRAPVRRRARHGDGAQARALPRGGGQQPLWRHPHGPRRGPHGRPRPRRQRQRAPGQDRPL